MNTQLLIDTARAMVADDKGVLPMDESHLTCNKRCQQANVKAAQQALLPRSKCNRAARRGEYTTAMEVDRL